MSHTQPSTSPSISSSLPPSLHDTHSLHPKLIVFYSTEISVHIEQIHAVPMLHITRTHYFCVPEIGIIRDLSLLSQTCFSVRIERTQTHKDIHPPLTLAPDTQSPCIRTLHRHVHTRHHNTHPSPPPTAFSRKCALSSCVTCGRDDSQRSAERCPTTSEVTTACHTET